MRLSEHVRSHTKGPGDIGMPSISLTAAGFQGKRLSQLADRQTFRISRFSRSPSLARAVCGPSEGVDDDKRRPVTTGIRRGLERPAAGRTPSTMRDSPTRKPHRKVSAACGRLAVALDTARAEGSAWAPWTPWRMKRTGKQHCASAGNLAS